MRMIRTVDGEGNDLCINIDDISLIMIFRKKEPSMCEVFFEPSPSAPSINVGESVGTLFRKIQKAQQE